MKKFNSLIKKAKKLKNNPKLFFKDFYIKRLGAIRNFNYFHNSINNQPDKFTVITAVYNTEKYLNDFFSSLVKQHLDFKKNIYIICIDDGSIDNSKNIILEWQKKYPHNIQYYYQKNNGQASARNLGIQYANTKWVTFIDPDDFVSTNYFYNAKKILLDNPDISILSVSMAVYKEKEKKAFYNTTPLSYCFNSKNKKINIKELSNQIQLSVCTAFFELKRIQENNIKFNPKIKPCFEDGKFVSEYLLKSQDKYIYFSSDSHYFYRVRQDNSSTTNNQWKKTEKYIGVFKYGYLQMFNDYLKENNSHIIPKNIQFTFLFFAIQYLKRFVNNKNDLSFLSNQQKEEFFSLFKECFKFIEKNTIMSFHLHGCSFYFKYCMLALKNEYPNFTMAYIDNFDIERKLIHLHLYTSNNFFIDFYINGRSVSPRFKKIIHAKFLENILLTEYHVCLPVDPSDTRLTIKSNLPVKISHAKKEYLDTIPIQNINFEPNREIDAPWLFLDRDTVADDNAEHFYRYMKDNHPNQIIYFALNRNSKDWDRLNTEGFNLIPFGSVLFEEILAASSVVLSSNADRYLMCYSGSDTLKTKKFVFLQHGVIMHNLSEWLNHVPKISLFITSTINEFNYISSIDSPYKYTYEVKLTGLARHDYLLKKQKKTKKKTKNILIMPTWRNNIVGNFKEGSTNREFNNDFEGTLYFKHWYSLLHSKKLKDIANKYKYTISFIPHPNISEYLHLFNLPGYINLPQEKQGFSIQDALAEAAFLITDYSSITFDMAFLNKGTLYYQFDIEEFKNNHTSKEGYFRYEDHGFGMIAYNETELLRNISMILNQQGRFPKKYREIIENTFVYRDGKNCERIYKEILNCFKPSIEINKKYILEDIESATSRKLTNRVKELYLQLPILDH